MSGQPETTTADGVRALPNARHEAFCQHYCGDYRRNAAAAYKAAGYRVSSDRAAASMAYTLLKRADVQARIDCIEQELTRILKIKVRDAIERLGIIATASMADFLDENGQVDTHLLKHSPSAAAISECFITVSPEGAVTARIKLKDDMRALELLGLVAKDQQQQQQQQSVLIVKV